MDYRRRRRDLARAVEEEKEIACFAITSTANLRYFFDYIGRSYERFCCGLLNEDGTRSALVMPMLDLEKAKKSSADEYFPWTDTQGYAEALRKALSFLRARSAKSVGTEDALTLGQMDQIRKVASGAKFKSISREASDLRLVKTDEEVESTKDAARSLGRVYSTLEHLLRPGKTEAEIGMEIVKIMLEERLDPSETPLVQSGPNSAVPHSTVSSRVLRRGDMVVVDASAPNKSGYYADFTRTYCLGRANEKQNRVFEIVKEAESLGVATCASKVRAQEIDRTTRGVIERAGYGDYFVHRTGHGLGLEVHEAPYIREGNEETLKIGMIFTVEPGIYLPGKFGVRIEDNVVLEDNKKVTNLTPMSHDLIELLA